MLGGIPLSFVFRDRPEEYGMVPDGVTQTEEEKNGARKAAAASMTLREAARTRAFWFMGVGFFVQMAAVNSVGVHIMPYLTGMGISRTVAAMVAMTGSMVSIVGRVGFGTISDYFKVKYCSAISIGLTCLAMFLLWNVNGSIALAFVFAVIHGAGQGGMSPLRSPLIRQYFGIKYFGTLFGMTSLFVTLGQMLGAPVTGWVKDTYGDYYSQWLLLGFATLVGAIMMLLVPTTAESPEPVTKAQASAS